MTAFASVITPFDRTPPIELGNAWRKRILPIGEIAYQGRTLKFTRGYLAGLVSAWQDRAYDAVPLQLADSQNAHTNDPERTRGWITDMTLGDDGLYITAEVSPRGQQVLRENPYLGVSARIVEQYQRSDGKFYPAAIQHVLATLDPRIPALGTWQPIEMSNGGDSALTIDLSNLSFAGEPAYSPADPFGGLSDAELGDLLDAMDEVGLLDGDSSGDELSGAELDALMQAVDAGDSTAAAFTEFDAAFSRHAQAAQAREDARAAAIVEDLMHPAHRDEDRMARIIARAQDGLYDGQEYGFAAEQAAAEILLANGGHGACGPVDDFGRCSSRYHELECGHSQAVDWVFSNPPASTGQAALANFQASVELANLAHGSTVWGDPDDPDEPGYVIPQQTVELASGLADEWGLHTSAQDPYADLLRPPAGPVSVQDELLAGMGYEMPAEVQPQRPGIRELAEQLGLR